MPEPTDIHLYLIWLIGFVAGVGITLVILRNEMRR